MTRVLNTVLVLSALGGSAALGGPQVAPAEAQARADQEVVGEALDIEYTYQSDLQRLLAMREQAMKDRNDARVQEINQIGLQLEEWRRVAMLEAWGRLNEAGRDSVKAQIVEVQSTARQEHAAEQARSGAAPTRIATVRANAEIQAELDDLRETIHERSVPEPAQPARHDAKRACVTQSGNTICIGGLPGGPAKTAAAKGHVKKSASGKAPASKSPQPTAKSAAQCPSQCPSMKKR